MGPGWASGLNAASFGASWLAIKAVGPAAPTATPAARTRRFGTDLGEGLRHFAGNRTLRTALIAGALAMPGGGALNALDFFFLTANLHAGSSLYGVLSACGGGGLLAGALPASVYAGRQGLERTFWLSLLALGALILIYARLTSFVPAARLRIVLGIPNAALNVSVGPLALQATTPHLLGRVFAVIQPALSLSSLLTTGLAGLLVSTIMRSLQIQALGIIWGAVDTIFSAAALLIAGARLFAWRQLRTTTTTPATPEQATATSAALPPAPPAVEPAGITP